MQLMTPMARHQAGVTLIEMMIALVVGLIVTGAVLALVVSIMQSNNETIQATRLTQELRSLADIMTLEMRRARGLTDPLANVGMGGAAASECDIAPVASATCLIFSSRSGGLSPLGTTASTSLTSPSGKYTLQLDVSQLGRATLCVPSGQPAMAGFDSCS